MTRRMRLGACLAALVTAAGVLRAPTMYAAPQAGPAIADVVLVGGKVVTVDRTFSVAQAVAIADGRFVKVGTSAEVRALAGPATRVIDLHGRTVVPGFIDTHPHVVGRGQREAPKVSLIGLPSVRAITQRVAEAAATTPAGEWIVTSPIGLPPDHFNLPESLEEKRWPTRRDLDEVAPNHPVYVPTPGTWPHPAVFNSQALQRLGITAQGPPDGDGVRIERVPQNGEPTGLIYGLHIYNRTAPLFVKVQGLIPRVTAAEQLDGIRRAVRENAEAGVTTIYESHGTQPSQLQAFRDLRAAGDLPGRVAFAYDINPGQSIEEIDAWMQTLTAATGAGGGDDAIKTIGVTVALDGASQFGASFMTRPYLDPFGQPTTGAVGVSEEKLTAIARLAALHNLRLNVTLAGDKAAEMALRAIEAANRDVPITDRRWLIQHFQHPTPDHVERAKRLGLVVTSYTAVDYSKGADVYVTRFSGDEWMRVVPTRWWFDAGVTLAQSTDGAHYEAMFVLWESLARVDGRTGRSLMSPAKQITREEALRMYTINGARVLFWEDRLGSIEAGKLADLVVLDHDVLTCPLDEIRDTTVVLTMIGGRAVYEAK